MSTITKERAQEIFIGNGPEPTASEERELARIALASLEAEAAYFINRVKHSDAYGEDVELRTYCYELDALKSKDDFGGEIVPVYTAPPAPVALPSGYSDFEEIWSSSTHPLTQDDEMKDFAWDIWNACRAAMLQGARNHPEDNLDMVDHSGDSNNMVEPVTTACKLRDAVEIIRNSGIAIDAEKIFAERDALNAPDCWCRTCRPVTFSDSRFVVCPECGNKRCPHANDHRNACTGSNEPGQEGSAYPAAPQQE
ncbi:hypothetical protein [Enterobacter kobei]|uniref:hypothetical protein n=1 Tax=Enterobacter kobei TaxID=208224 RepID=UPI0035C5EF6C